MNLFRIFWLCVLSLTNGLLLLMIVYIGNQTYNDILAWSGIGCLACFLGVTKILFDEIA
jgi:hypothetical protein